MCAGHDLGGESPILFVVVVGWKLPGTVGVDLEEGEVTWHWVGHHGLVDVVTRAECLASLPPRNHGVFEGTESLITSILHLLPPGRNGSPRLVGIADLPPKETVVAVPIWVSDGR